MICLDLEHAPVCTNSRYLPPFSKELHANDTCCFIPSSLWLHASSVALLLTTLRIGDLLFYLAERGNMFAKRQQQRPEQSQYLRRNVAEYGVLSKGMSESRECGAAGAPGMQVLAGGEQLL
jgi:hypothetical protein